MRAVRYALLVSLFCASAGVFMPASGEPANPVVFVVSEVAMATEPLAARPASVILRQAPGDEIEACSPNGNQQWVDTPALIPHPFIAAAHLAFQDHRPLALSPDMIWQLITQMAADEVRANPEPYRHWFAAHEQGRKTLRVRRDEFLPGSAANDWPGVFAEFESTIVGNVPDSPAVHFSHAFSTSSSVDLAARRVVLLSVASPFYTFRVDTLCGIPRIELHGTVDDWKWIRSQIGTLRVFNMERRTKAMIPLLDEFVSAAGGNANPAFWRSFYKFASLSGSNYISGWINVFFVAENEEALDEILHPDFCWSVPESTSLHPRAGNLSLALATHTYRSNGIVDVDFVWQLMETAKPMRLQAGFMGVEQDPKTLALRPATAWKVVHSKQTKDERVAMDFLGRITELSIAEVFTIQFGFAFDSASGRIAIRSDAKGDKRDKRFWSKLFANMPRTNTVDLQFMTLGITPPEEDTAICEAMLTAPAIKKVIVPPDLSEDCLRILRGRKDWIFEKPKPPAE